MCTQHLAACVFISTAAAVAGQGVGEPDVVLRIVFRSGFLRLLTLSWEEVGVRSKEVAQIPRENFQMPKSKHRARTQEMSCTTFRTWGAWRLVLTSLVCLCGFVYFMCVGAHCMSDLHWNHMWEHCPETHEKQSLSVHYMARNIWTPNRHTRICLLSIMSKIVSLFAVIITSSILWILRFWSLAVGIYLISHEH